MIVNEFSSIQGKIQKLGKEYSIQEPIGKCLFLS